jgi:hypothetical protein
VFRIFELDDDLFAVPSHNPAAETYNRPDVQANLKRNIRVADRVIVSTPPLADKVSKLNPAVVVVPNYIPERAVVAPLDMPAFSFGWSGSPTHAHDWASTTGNYVYRYTGDALVSCTFEDRDSVRGALEEAAARLATPVLASDVSILEREVEGLLDRVENRPEVLARLDCLPLAHTPTLTRYDKALLAIGLFAGAIALSVSGLLPLTIGLSLVVIAFVLADIVPVREIYEAIEWPIIILLGALIPMGDALESSGGTMLIANGIAQVTQTFPAWVALTAMLVVTMLLSDILNNAATAVITAPIAYGLANAMGVNPDAFLMAVAIGASCAFLTPIGHQNSLLIMGPGGYQFSDYWKFGLPLELLTVAVAVPAILVFWPL